MLHNMPTILIKLIEEAEKIDTAPKALIEASIAMIDHTSLKDGAVAMAGGETTDEIAALAKTAAQGADDHAAAICVYPDKLEEVRRALEGLEGGSVVKLAAVNNFPHGEDTGVNAAQQVAEAVARGADEIDTVLDYEAFLAGDQDEVAAKLEAVRLACDQNDATLKIILKGSVYQDYNDLYKAAQLACRYCRDGDFVKSCTGKMPKDGFGKGVPDASTMDMGAAMMQAVADYNRENGTKIGVKISGGVKTPIDCARYDFMLRQIMGDEFATPDYFRYGASSLVGNLRDALTNGGVLANAKAQISRASGMDNGGY